MNWLIAHRDLVLVFGAGFVAGAAPLLAIGIVVGVLASIAWKWWLG